MILPFENLAERYEPDTGVRSPISGRVFVTGPAAVGADHFLTGQLLSHVQRDTAFAILPAGDPATVAEAFGDGRSAMGNSSSGFRSSAGGWGPTRFSPVMSTVFGSASVAGFRPSRPLRSHLTYVGRDRAFWDNAKT